jgi:hypothetical protein
VGPPVIWAWAGPVSGVALMLLVAFGDRGGAVGGGGGVGMGAIASGGLSNALQSGWESSGEHTRVNAFGGQRFEWTTAGGSPSSNGSPRQLGTNQLSP